MKLPNGEALDFKKLFGQWLQHSGRAYACGAKRMRLWVQFLQGVGHFSSLSVPQWCVLNQVHQGGGSIKNGCLAVGKKP